jgi:hypothetical protein
MFGDSIMKNSEAETAKYGRDGGQRLGQAERPDEKDVSAAQEKKK